MKPATKALLLFLFIIAAANAKGLPIDQDKIIFDYKKRFNNIISSNIFSTPAELRSNKELRNAIFEYLHKQNPKQALVDNTELEKLWNFYINSKFGGRKQFETKLKQGYLSEADVKDRFRDNLVLLRYFKEQVEPRLEDELLKRAAILDYAEEHDIRYPSEALKHKFFTTVESYGGQANFNKYLEDNALSISDIFYFIKSDFLLPFIKEDCFKSKLSLDAAYRESLDKDILEYYQNHKNSKYTIPDQYYFDEVYIPKDKNKSLELKATVNKLHSELKELANAEELCRKYPVAQYIKLKEPVRADSKLYSNLIKNAILGRSLNYISPVLENSKAYYIVIIRKIESGKQLSLDDVRAEIYDIIKERKLQALQIPSIGQI